MNHDMAFGQRLDRGWNKEQLMTYYTLSEAQYERVMASLKSIRSRRSEGAVKWADCRHASWFAS